MLCRICGCDLSQNSNDCDNFCKSCGKCSKPHNDNMVLCPNCGYLNYIENNDISLIQSIKEKLNI